MEQNCGNCRYCGEWGEADQYGSKWAKCLWDNPLPSCVVEFEKIHLVDLQRDFDRYGFCRDSRSPIGYIHKCPAWLSLVALGSCRTGGTNG